MHFKADRRSSRLRFKTLLCGRPHWGARFKYKKMLLTYGNIRKSRILKYMYYEDIDDNLYFNRLEEYEKSIPYKQFLSIREFLHDTDIVIIKNKNDISIYAFSRNKTKCYNIIFKNAKFCH